MKSKTHDEVKTEGQNESKIQENYLICVYFKLHMKLFVSYLLGCQLYYLMLCKWCDNRKVKKV